MGFGGDCILKEWIRPSKLNRKTKQSQRRQAQSTELINM
jgi:hypothetical protein